MWTRFFLKAKRHSAFSYRPTATASRLSPPPQPLRKTQNVFIFLGCLCRKTEAIAKGSGGNKWQANAENGRVGEETQSISAQQRYRIFFLYGLSLKPACVTEPHTRKELENITSEGQG
jgi:hypothetical protein